MIGEGIHSDISHKEYHSLPYVSNSYLGRLDKCPAAAKVPQEDTPSLLFGRAFHAFCLEGMESFTRDFAVAPAVDRRTKEGKAIWSKFQEDNEGKDVLSDTDYQKIVDMGGAILRHPFAKELLFKGVSEQTVIWQDPETGIMCKCRPDRIPDGVHGVLIDLKSTRDASEHAFLRSITSYGYARQNAFYSDGINAISGQVIDAFAFIAVEVDPPHRVEVYTLSPEFVEYGRTEYMRLLRIEKECRKSGYPNYQNAGAVELYLPKYLGGF